VLVKMGRLAVAALFGGSIGAAVVASCADDCKDGRQWCVNACVDKGSDPGNCGACGKLCGLASSCAGGNCAPAGVTPDGGDTSPPAKCAECLASSSAISSCADALGACRDEPSCFAWTACVTSCFGDGYGGACFDACAVDAGASVSALVGPVMVCACRACATQCAPLCLIAVIALTDGGASDGARSDATSP
jgi:hypothetical protein